MGEKKPSKIKDIYDGKLIQVWEDDDMIFLNFLTNAITISMEKDIYDDLKEDFRQLLTK